MIVIKIVVLLPVTLRRLRLVGTMPSLRDLKESEEAFSLCGPERAFSRSEGSFINLKVRYAQVLLVLFQPKRPLSVDPGG